MMPTWLNQREWEESHYIHPSSEAGKEIAETERASAEDRKRKHLEDFTPAYDEWIRDAALNTYEDSSEFQEQFSEHIAGSIKRRRTMGSERAAELLENQMRSANDRADLIVEFWQKSKGSDLPSFWEWDASFNDSKFVA